MNIRPWTIEDQYQNLPVVIFLGRTNVGKSTLFNRLTEQHQALVSDIENTTRDNNLGVVKWQRKKFLLVDTAGVIDSRFLSRKSFSNQATGEVEKKTQQRLGELFKKAAVIVFLVDAKGGLLPEDKALAKFLTRRPELSSRVILAVNKVDGASQVWDASDFSRLNLGDPHLLSAATGRGTGDLLDLVLAKLKEQNNEKVDDDEIDEKRVIKACIIGQPNVGKSSLLNSFLGYERVLVSPQPHTTREPQFMELIYNGQKIKFIDTAGLSHHGHQGKGLEKFGIAKSLAALKQADIALLVIDIKQGITHQDARIVQEIMDVGKSFAIIANKWDLIEERNTKKWTQYINSHLPFATWASLLFISAKTGAKVDQIMDLIVELDQARARELSPSQLDKFLKRIVKIHPPVRGRGQNRPRIYEIRQSGTRPPRFSVRIGTKEDLDYNYLRFIENQLRSQFNLAGCPVRLRVIKRNLLPREIKDLAGAKKAAAK